LFMTLISFDVETSISIANWPERWIFSSAPIYLPRPYTF
jgi:hypothetical protein